MPRFQFDIGLEAMTMTETTVTDGVHNLKIGNYMPLKYPSANGTITTGMINKIFVANNPYEEGESYSLFGKVFTVTNPKVSIGKGDYIKANFDFSDNTLRLVNLSRTEFAPTDIVTEENYDYINLAALTGPVEIFNLPVKIMHDSDVTVDVNVGCRLREGILTLKMYIDEISTTEPVSVVDYSCNADMSDYEKNTGVTMSHSLYHRNKFEEFNIRVTAEYSATDYVYEHPYVDDKTPIILHNEKEIYPVFNSGAAINLGKSIISVSGKMIELNMPVYENRPDESIKATDITPDDPSYLYDFDIYYRKIENDSEIELFQIDDNIKTYPKAFRIFLPDEIEGLPITKFHSGLFRRMDIRHIRLPKYLKNTGDGVSLDRSQYIRSLYPGPERGNMSVDFNGNNNDINIGVFFKRYFSYWDNSFPETVSMETIKPYTIGMPRLFSYDSQTPVGSITYNIDSDYIGGGNYHYYTDISPGSSDSRRSELNPMYNHTIDRQHDDFSVCNKELYYTPKPSKYIGALIEYILAGKTSLTLEPGNRDFVEIDDICESITENIFPRGTTVVTGKDILEWLDSTFSCFITFSIPDTTKYIQRYAFNNIAFAEQGYFIDNLITDDMYSFSIRNHEYLYDVKSKTVIPHSRGGLLNGLGKNIRVIDKNAFQNCYIAQDIHIPNTARHIDLSGNSVWHFNTYGWNQYNKYDDTFRLINYVSYSDAQYAGVDRMGVKIPPKNPNASMYNTNAIVYNDIFKTSPMYSVTLDSLYAMPDMFLAEATHSAMLTIDAPVKNELDSSDEDVQLYLDISYWTQISRTNITKYNFPLCDNQVEETPEYDNGKEWERTTWEWQPAPYEKYYAKRTYYDAQELKTYPQYYTYIDTSSPFDAAVDILEPLVIPSHTTLRIGALVADDLVFEDNTSNLLVYNKFGNEPYSPNFFLDRTYIKLAKYRGDLSRGLDYYMDTLVHLNARHGFDSFFFNEDRTHTTFMKGIEATNYYPELTQLGTTEPLYLANDNEAGIHYSFAGNVFAEVLVYPRIIDLGNIDSEVPGEFYGDNVFDPSSFNIDTFNIRNDGQYFTSAAYKPRQLYFPRYLHGCTYLPELPNSVFPPCRYHWCGQNTIHITAKVIGWNSLVDMREGYGTMLDPEYNTSQYALGWWDGNFTVNEHSSNKNFHRDWDTDNEMSDEDCLRRMDVYDSGSYPNDYPNNYWMRQSERYSTATQNLYFGQGTEIIRKNAVGTYPSLFRRYESDYATIFIPPSVKTIEDDAIIASNYVLYVPDGCTVGSLYCPDATIRRLIRTRNYKSHDAMYAEAVEIRYYDVANDMQSHYTYDTTESSAKITGFSDSPESAPEQRKSIGTYLMPDEYNGLPITEISPIFYDNEDVRHVVGEIFPSENLIEIPDNYAKDCIHLLKSIIPANVTRIGNNAFEHCLKMYNLDFLANNITYIGDYAFAYCGSHNLAETFEDITKLTYGENGEWKHELYKHPSSQGMRDRTAPNCALNKLDISKCEYIGSYAFFNSNIIKGVVNLPVNSSYTTIKEGTFKYCSGITKIIIPPNVKTIEPYAFEHMTDLEEIVIPSTVDNADLSFSGCMRLKKVIIQPSDNPDAVRNITDRGFAHCMNIDKNSFDISGINGSIGAKAFHHFSYDVENLDLYCSSVGENAVSTGNLRSITFHRNCSFSNLQPVCTADALRYDNPEKFNYKLRHVYADDGVTLTVNSNKNFLSWYIDFPVDKCVGLDKFTNCRNTKTCCCFSDIEDMILADTAPATNKYKNKFSLEIPTPNAELPGTDLHSADLFNSTQFKRIPIVIPDEYWADIYEYSMDYAVSNVGDTDTFNFHNKTRSLYDSLWTLIYTKKSIYDELLPAGKAPFDKFVPFGIIIEYDENGVMCNARIDDFNGMIAKIKNGGNTLANIEVPALSSAEFKNTGLIDIKLSDSVTSIPSNCFDTTLLSESSVQSILDSPNITSFGSECFSFDKEHISSYEGFNPFKKECKQLVSDEIEGRLYTNTELIYGHYKYIILLKRNKDGVVCDKSGKKWDMIYRIYDLYNTDKIETPSEDVLYLVKYIDKDTGNLEYKDMTPEQEKADRETAVEYWKMNMDSLYRGMQTYPMVYCVDNFNAYDVSKYYRTKKVPTEVVMLNDMILDIYEKGSNSEYYDNFIVIDKMPDIKPIKHLDFTNVDMTKFTYYKNSGGGQFLGQTMLESVTIPDTCTVLPSFIFSYCTRLHIDIPESIRTFEYDCLNYTDLYGNYVFRNAEFKGEMHSSHYSGKAIGTMTFIDCVNFPSGIHEGIFLMKSEIGNSYTVNYNCDADYQFGEEITELVANSDSTRTIDIVIPDTISKITSPNNGFTELANIEVDLGEAQFDESDADNNYYLFTSDSWNRFWTKRMDGLDTCKVKKITCNSEYIPRFFCTRNDLIESVVLGDKVKYIDAGFLCGCNVSTKNGAVFDRLTFSLPENIEAICADSFISRTKLDVVDLSSLPHVALTSDDLHNRVYTDTNEDVLSTDTTRGVCECAVHLTLPTDPDVYFPQGAFALTNYSTDSRMNEFTGARMKTVNFNGAERLPNYAFYGQTVLESVTASKDFYLGTESDVASDRNHRCFFNCKQLTSFPFSHLKGRIGYNEFYGCEVLETPDGNCTFSGITALNAYGEYSDTDTTNTVNNYSGAFKNCIAITKLTFDDTCTFTFVGADFAYGCTALREVRLPKTCMRICSGAFDECTVLGSIIAPEGIVVETNGIFLNTTIHHYNVETGEMID